MTNTEEMQHSGFYGPSTMCIGGQALPRKAGISGSGSFSVLFMMNWTTLEAQQLAIAIS